MFPSIRLNKATLVAAGASAAFTLITLHAQAGTNDNSDAWVEGAAVRRSTGDRSACPEGYHCVWTEPNYRGKMFMLYYCGRYAMHDWNGVGSDWNHQTDNVQMKYLMRDGSVGGRRNARDGGNLDMTPFWYIEPC